MTNQAYVEVAAGESRKKRRMQPNMSFRDVLDRLMDENKRSKDFLVPYRDLRAQAVEQDGHHRLMLSIKGAGQFAVCEPVLDQISTHCMLDGSRTLPTAYLKLLLEDKTNRKAVEMAAANVNHWLERRSGEFYRNRKGEPIRDGEKRARVRLIATDAAEYVCRALLSDKYLVLPNAQLLTTVVNVITGKDGKAGDLAETASAVRGAVLFDWSHNMFELNVGVVNPMFAMDLKHPERGVVQATPSTSGTFLYPGARHAYTPGQPFKDPNSHWVMPAAFITNSETGGGSATVEMSLLEAVCENSSKLSAFSRRHIGSRQVSVDGYESENTQRKYIELIGSQFADAMRQVFDIKKFEENCLRMLGLFSQDIVSVEETTKWILQQAQALDLLNDALRAYEQFTPGKNSVGDVQRAITNIAQEQVPAKADRLTSLAGDLVSGDVSVAKHLLVSA